MERIANSEDAADGVLPIRAAQPDDAARADNMTISVPSALWTAINGGLANHMSRVTQLSLMRFHPKY